MAVLISEGSEMEALSSAVKKAHEIMKSIDSLVHSDLNRGEQQRRTGHRFHHIVEKLQILFELKYRSIWSTGRFSNAQIIDLIKFLDQFRFYFDVIKQDLEIDYSLLEAELINVFEAFQALIN